MTAPRERINVSAPPGGWAYPWENVAEIANAFPREAWSLIGGLMVELHAVHRGLTPPRTTTDVDMILHIETQRGRASEAGTALKKLGYSMVEPLDSRSGQAHRFTRPTRHGGDSGPARDNNDIVDVLSADHAAPSIREPLGGHAMVQVEGGTQALRRTIEMTLEIHGGEATTISVPDAYGAVLLKAAAHKAYSLDRERHLADAVVLLACIENPFAEAEKPASQSDRARLLYLKSCLDGAGISAWSALTGQPLADARAALGILLDAQ